MALKRGPHARSHVMTGARTPMAPCLAWAISRALSDLRSQIAHLERGAARPDLARRLREQSDAAARSPLAHDQLVGVGCSRLADAGPDLPVHMALDALLAPPDALHQLELRRAVFEEGGDEVLRLDVSMAVASEERRGRSLVGRDPDTLAIYLRRTAAVNRLLWDHPAIPADTTARAGMLTAVQALESRAQQLLRLPPPNVVPLRPRNPCP